MHNVATLAANAVDHMHAGAAPAGEPLQVSAVVRKLFVVLHGYYGNLFVGKFSTGQKDGSGRDKGTVAAMKVWDSKLGRFPGDVLETAAGRLSSEHPKFPPNLPEFELLCEAAMPRQTFAEENNLVRLPAPVVTPVVVSLAKRNDGKDWARTLLARHEAGEVLKPIQLRFAREAVGITPHKVVA